MGELLLEVGRCVEGLSSAQRDAHIGSHKNAEFASDGHTDALFADRSLHYLVLQGINT